jgi:uncharacterized protein
MKPLALFAFFFIIGFSVQGQTVPYNVVFDLTSKDTNDHKTVIRWLELISKERPDAQLEVVLYSQSLDMVTKDKSVVAPALERLTQNKNIKVSVCAVTMKRYQVEPSQLVRGVTVVPDGIYEIISRQKEGWGYIKATH